MVSSTQVQSRAVMQHAAINTFSGSNRPPWAFPAAVNSREHRHAPLAARYQKYRRLGDPRIGHLAEERQEML
jgi:hypothetical protein